MSRLESRAKAREGMTAGPEGTTGAMPADRASRPACGRVHVANVSERRDFAGGREPGTQFSREYASARRPGAESGHYGMTDSITRGRHH